MIRRKDGMVRHIRRKESKKEKRARKEKRKKLQKLRQLIEKLDGIVVFKRIHPATMETLFKELEPNIFMAEWKKIKGSVRKIAFLPLTIPRVPTLMKAAFYLKWLFPICAAISVIIMIRRAEFTIFLITGLSSMLAGFGFITTDYTIRRKIVKFEEEHATKFSRGRRQIKDLAQKLILRLVRDLEKYNEDPEDYRMTLFFKDYSGIKIKKRINKKLRVFPRKYVTYVVIPSKDEI